MAATTATSALQSSATNSAGGTTTGSWTDISACYGGTVRGKVTNGGTGPTVAAYMDIEASEDGSGTNATRIARLTAQLGNSVASHFTYPLGAGHRYIRTVFSGNTGQSVTVEAHVDKLTAI